MERAGPQFLQLHELFDRLRSEVDEFADTIPERIAALGHVADGRLQTVVAASALYVYPLESRHGEAHLRASAASLAEFGKRARANIAASETAGDSDTADVFTDFSARATSNSGFSRCTCSTTDRRRVCPVWLPLTPERDGGALFHLAARRRANRIFS